MSRIVEYAALSDSQIVDLLFTEGDLLPRAAVDEIIRRGVPLAPALVGIIDDDGVWEAEPPRGWAVVHATFILASMRPPGALEALIRSIYRADDLGFDWANEHARSLLGSFGPPAVPKLAAAALDSTRSAIVRMVLKDALGWIGRNHAEVRDEVTKTLRAVIHDTASDIDVRVSAARELLEFALPGDRELILSVADGTVVDEREVRDIYEAQAPTPLHPLDDWLKFYDPAEIAGRQEEAEAPEEDGAGESEAAWEPEASLSMIPEPSADPDLPPPPLRAEAKVGRNAPCPCASGKKFKKCCGR